MAVTASKTFVTGEILTASDLNTLNTNILSNGEDLGWPATKAKDLDGNELILSSDQNDSITADTNGQIDFRVGSTDVLVLTGTTLKFLGSDLTTRSDLRALGLPGISARLSWTELRVNQIEEQSILEHQVFG